MESENPQPQELSEEQKLGQEEYIILAEIAQTAGHIMDLEESIKDARHINRNNFKKLNNVRIKMQPFLEAAKKKAAESQQQAPLDPKPSPFVKSDQ